MTLNRYPVVSIVGRPNVGKSSLFNRILGRRVAVIDDEPGVTRDRNYMQASWNGVDFMLVDTGGLLPEADGGMAEEVNRQVDTAMSESAAVVLVVDGSAGPTDLDERIARRLRRSFSDRLILAVNKAEGQEARMEAGRHMSLGCGEPMPISALHGDGVGDLLDRVCVLLRAHGSPSGAVKSAVPVRIAVVGRPNAGKSSFVNRILNQDRMIVDAVPGTTRDAIDSSVVLDRRPVVIVDTAGLRRKSQVKGGIEYFSNLRALSSIERCDVALLMVDAAERTAEQNLKIVTKIKEMHRGVVVCWNKWDLVEKDTKTFDRAAVEVRRLYMELRHVPIVAISALTGQRARRALELALQVHDRMRELVAPGQFENTLLEWVRSHPHPIVANKAVRILGGKPREAEHPLFELFCTNHRLVRPAYERFLINKIYDTYGFEGCPVVLQFKPAGRPRRKKAEVRMGHGRAEER